VVDIVHIPRRSFIEWLRAAVPDFIPNPELLGNDLDYVVVCEFARYICARASSGDWEAVQKGVDFLEMYVAQGGSYSRDLVLEGLESLEASCQGFERIQACFGPKILALWSEALGGN